FGGKGESTTQDGASSQAPCEIQLEHILRNRSTRRSDPHPYPNSQSW
ncbi:599_t:CDS:1, partial [Acaulospora colombiana]